MTLFEKTKFFHIIYSPFTGGNHIVNLLTLSSVFQPKFTSNNYVNDLINFYESKLNSIVKINYDADIISKGYNVHVYDSNNLFTYVYKNLDKFKNNQCTIVQGHSDEYKVGLTNQLFKNNFFKYLPLTKALLVTTPNNTSSRLFKRVSYFNQTNSYSFPISTDNYKIPFTIAGYEIFNNSNAFMIDSDLFGENNGSYYFQNFCNETLNIILPDEIHILHQLWIKMVDQSLVHK